MYNSIPVESTSKPYHPLHDPGLPCPELLKLWSRLKLSEPSQEPRLQLWLIQDINGGGAVGGRHRLTMIFLPSPSFRTCLALKVSMLLVIVELWRGWRDLQVKVNCPWSGELHLTHGPWPPPLPRSFVGKRFAGSPNRQYSAGCLDSDRHMLATLHVTRA